MANTKMRAVVINGPKDYGIQMIDVPTPGYKEVLLKVKAVSICGSDPKIFDGKFAGMWPPDFPFIAGHEVSGEIVDLGESVNEFNVGDRVACQAHSGCGYCRNCMQGNYNLCLNYGKLNKGHRHYGFTTQGGYAEYNVYSVKAITKLPDNVSFNEGALVDTLGTSYHGLELSGVIAGGTSVIIGPGPVGILAMQLAKSMGSKTIVVGRKERLQAAKRLGADMIVDYEKEEPVQAIMNLTNGLGADEVFECVGTSTAIGQSIKVAKKNGKVVLLGIPVEDELLIPLKGAILNQVSILGSRANPNVSDLVLQLISDGKINAQGLITHEFPLEKMKEAMNTFVDRTDGALKVIVKP